jgi:hypothetical protein
MMVKVFDLRAPLTMKPPMFPLDPAMQRRCHETLQRAILDRRLQVAYALQSHR